MMTEKLINKLKEATILSEGERIQEAKAKLMFIKTQNNIKDIVFISAVLDKYDRIVKEIENVFVRKK